MIRNAFNGGELSATMAMRSDVDITQRGCSRLVNWDVGQTGGLQRRRGFRHVGDAQGVESRLFAFGAAEDDKYVVELGARLLRVWSCDGEVVWETESGYEAEWLAGVRVLQVNSVMLFLCGRRCPMELMHRRDGGWSWGEFEFKTPPWRMSEWRDSVLRVHRDANELYSVEFEEGEDDDEEGRVAGEWLRASYYTEGRELKMGADEVWERVKSSHERGWLDAGVVVKEGDVVVVRQEPEMSVWSCIAAFNGDTFVEGLVDPGNYEGNFQAASDGSGWDVTVSALSKSVTVAKGKRLRLESGYWDVWTCKKEWNGAVDWREGAADCEDYPGHFVRGIMLGSAPCKGAWKFYCAGTWYGAYEVRASYEGDGGVGDAWELRAEVRSNNAQPSNAPEGGDESAEACYISLWLTRVRAYGKTWAKVCLPADRCGNCLSVGGYKHDMMLRRAGVYADTGVAYYRRVERVKDEWQGAVETRDWSWGAFTQEYGFPRLACIYDQRLVLAGTDAQPMSLWLSQTDDIDNFDVVDAANGALDLTVSGETQDPIRWLEGQNGRIVFGTSRGEYVIQSGDGQALSAGNARVERHGFGGAADVAHVQCGEQVIYVARGGGRVKQYAYDYAQDAYLSSDLNAFADHLLREGGGVKEGCVLAKPDARAVFVLRSGELALMTYNSMHQVNAWHRYVTAGKFLSATAVLNDGAADALYVVVEREGRCRIEVLDEGSDYVDGEEGLDYVSEMMTNMLACGQVNGEKKNAGRAMFYVQGGGRVDGVEVSLDGGEVWSRIAAPPVVSLPEGWVQVSGFGRWEWEVKVGLRVSGRRGFGVLALQV